MEVRHFISNDVVTCTAFGKTSKTCEDFNKLIIQLSSLL